MNWSGSQMSHLFNPPTLITATEVTGYLDQNDRQVFCPPQTLGLISDNCKTAVRGNCFRKSLQGCQLPLVTFALVTFFTLWALWLYFSCVYNVGYSFLNKWTRHKDLVTPTRNLLPDSEDICIVAPCQRAGGMFGRDSDPCWRTRRVCWSLDHFNFWSYHRIYMIDSNATSDNITKTVPFMIVWLQNNHTRLFFKNKPTDALLR